MVWQRVADLQDNLEHIAIIMDEDKRDWAKFKRS